MLRHVWSGLRGHLIVGLSLAPGRLHLDAHKYVEAVRGVLPNIASATHNGVVLLIVLLIAFLDGTGSGTDCSTCSCAAAKVKKNALCGYFFRFVGGGGNHFLP